MVLWMSRLEREAITIAAMYRMWCAGRHGTRGALCDACRDELGYATARIGKCPHGEEKPTCKNCTIHCFSPAMKGRVREVMRWAGPRMTWRHPVLTFFHFVDRFRSGRVEKRRAARVASGPGG